MKNQPENGKQHISSNLDGYKQRVTDIVSRAHIRRATLLDPSLDDSGKFLTDHKARGQNRKAVVSNSVYESAGEGAPMILGAHSRALQAFCQRYGRPPVTKSSPAPTTPSRAPCRSARAKACPTSSSPRT